MSIESVGSLVFSVDFPEQAFQFCDFGFRYVWPDFEIGEMRPQFSFSFAAGVCFQAGLYSGFAIGHSNVDDIVFLDPRTMPVQSINSSEALLHQLDLCLGNPLTAASH